MNFDIAANREVFVENVLNYIYGKVPTEAGAYDAIIATGYSTVVLDKPLTEHDMELAEKRFDDPDYVFSEEELAKCADTDRDGLFDFEEVMFYSDCAEENEFIKFKNGNIELPQVADIMRIFEVNGIYAYVDGGVEAARKQYGDCWAIFLTEPVLPIISDPTSVDGDGDGILDRYDGEALVYDSFPDLFKYYINEGYMQHCDVVAVYNNSYVCNNVSISALKYLPKECEIPDVTGFKTVSIYSLQYKNKCIYGVSKNNITQLSGSLLFVLYASIELMDYYKVKENNQVFNVSGRGITFCASFTGMNYTGSINYIFDNNGNNQIQLSSGGGISTGTGVSITKNFFIATVDDMENMDGLGFNIGGSIGKMVAAGGDLLFMPIDVNEDGDFFDDEDKWHWGISCSAGFGGGVEGHVNGSYANSILSWNNYDLVEEVLKHIINEVVS